MIYCDFSFNYVVSSFLVNHHLLNNRVNVDDNVPTSNQAEILYFGVIPPNSILNIADYIPFSQESNNLKVPKVLRVVYMFISLNFGYVQLV